MGVEISDEEIEESYAIFSGEPKQEGLRMDPRSTTDPALIKLVKDGNASSTPRIIEKCNRIQDLRIITKEVRQKPMDNDNKTNSEIPKDQHVDVIGNNSNLEQIFGDDKPRNIQSDETSCKEKESQNINARYQRTVDGKGRIIFSNQRIILGNEFRNKVVFVESIQSSNNIAIYPDLLSNKPIIVKERTLNTHRKTDDKGNFHYLGRKYKLGANFASKSIIIENADNHSKLVIFPDIDADCTPIVITRKIGVPEIERIVSIRGKVGYHAKRYFLGSQYQGKKVLISRNDEDGSLSFNIEGGTTVVLKEGDNGRKLGKTISNEGYLFFRGSKYLIGKQYKGKMVIPKIVNEGRTIEVEFHDSSIKTKSIHLNQNRDKETIPQIRRVDSSGNILYNSRRTFIGRKFSNQNVIVIEDKKNKSLIISRNSPTKNRKVIIPLVEPAADHVIKGSISIHRIVSKIGVIQLNGTKIVVGRRYAGQIIRIKKYDDKEIHFEAIVDGNIKQIEKKFRDKQDNIRKVKKNGLISYLGRDINLGVAMGRKEVIIKPGEDNSYIKVFPVSKDDFPPFILKINQPFSSIERRKIDQEGYLYYRDARVNLGKEFAHRSVYVKNIKETGEIEIFSDNTGSQLLRTIHHETELNQSWKTSSDGVITYSGSKINIGVEYAGVCVRIVPTSDDTSIRVIPLDGKSSEKVIDLNENKILSNIRKVTSSGKIEYKGKRIHVGKGNAQQKVTIKESMNGVIVGIPTTNEEISKQTKDVNYHNLPSRRLISGKTETYELSRTINISQFLALNLEDIENIVKSRRDGILIGVLSNRFNIDYADLFHFFTVNTITPKKWSDEEIKDYLDHLHPKSRILGFDAESDRIQIDCGEGHTYSTTRSNLFKGRWCSDCWWEQKYRREGLCRNIVAELFGIEFIKANRGSLPWLKNSDGKHLELDIYSPQLQIAFEVQGEQHYQFIDFFHRTEEKFKHLITNDACKIERCAANQTTLILIPYWTPDQLVKDHILKEVEERGLASLLAHKYQDAIKQKAKFGEKVVPRSEGDAKTVGLDAFMGK